MPLDRGLLAALTAREVERFTAEHPRSARALRTCSRLADGRRPDAVDDALGGRLPGLRARGVGRADRRRRRPRVRRPVPRRHRRDARPRPRAGRGGGARPARARDHDDAADRGRGLGRRGARAPLRPAALAVHADRHGRQPDGAAARPPAHRPPARAGLLLLLPRLGRRGVRRPGPRRAHARARGQRRPGGRPRADHARDRVQRPRGARGGARRRPRRVRARGAGDDQHGDHPAGARLPRRPARADARGRDAADHRRDAHVLRRARRLHGGVGARAGPAEHRQGDRQRHPVRGAGPLRRGRRGAARRSRRRLRGHGRRRRHAGGQRAVGGRDARHARARAHRGGVRGHDPARDPLPRGRRARDRRARARLARDPARLPRGVRLLPGAAATDPRRTRPPTRSSSTSCTCTRSTAAC